MNAIPRPRWAALALTALLAVAAATAGTACNPVQRSWSWKAGTTHGAIIETTAGRASLGIYRKPRSVLYAVYKVGGIKAVQDGIWAVGRPPAYSRTFTYRGRTITTSFGTNALRDATHRLIYQDPSDLRGALLEAEANRDCLALTLVSYGAPTRNWTHKQTGCQMGGLP